MSKEPREKRQFSVTEKFQIVKEGLTTDLGMSGVCRKHDISPTQYYQWQERFFEGAKEGLERKSRQDDTKEQRRIAKLEAEAQRMKDVIAEIAAENISLKKNFGES